MSSYLFYFSAKDRKLGYGDGRKIRTGSTHKVKGPVVRCSNGLHACRSILAANEYLKGPVLHLVTLSGEVQDQGIKWAATERTYHASRNIESVLRAFARKQAAINLHLVRRHVTPSQFKTIKRWVLKGDETARLETRKLAWALSRSAKLAAKEVESEAAASPHIRRRAAAESIAYSTHQVAILSANSACSMAIWASGLRRGSWATHILKAENLLHQMVKEYTGWAI